MSAKKIITAGILALTLLLSSGVQAREAGSSADGPKWLRDPFRYVTALSNNQGRAPLQNRQQDSSTDDSKGLQGIFVRNGSYQALYDGELVGASERVGNVLIREIALYSIIIEDGAGRRRIDLFHEK